MNHSVLHALDGKTVAISTIGGSVIRGVLDTFGLSTDSGTVHLDQEVKITNGWREQSSQHWHHTVQADQITSISWEGTHDD